MLDVSFLYFETSGKENGLRKENHSYPTGPPSLSGKVYLLFASLGILITLGSNSTFEPG